MEEILNIVKRKVIKEKLKIFIELGKSTIDADKEKRRVLIEEIADEIDAKTCREVLRTLNLTEDEKLKFEQILYSKIKDENGFAENFFYLFQKDSYNLSNKFKGGYVGIKRYMQTSSKFKGVVVPKEISEELDRLAIVQTTTEAVITDVMIEQHLFGDRNPDLLLPFSYEKVEVNNSQK